ncbi:MAG: 4-hydroxy-3-methylbut-2-enyl diphosphate reductase [Alphaproteobacteria bacterium]|nr:4-hydroxy-3-methylbut-2-enyl diphosphate reductase [Alphaproteobacteria bacterium]
MSVTCYLLSPRGYCSGVTRAVSMAKQVMKLYGTFYVTEDVIHNKTFIKQLEQRGMIKVDSVDDIPDGSTLMFSTHGVSPKIVEKAEKKGLTTIDATCPIVKSIQNDVKSAIEQGNNVIIIGHKSHAEIVALMGYADGAKFYVVYNEIDIDLLPDFSDDDVVYFTQTTLDYSAVERIVDKLKEKFPRIKPGSNNNVCYATRERQEVVRKIAHSVDLLVVVGSSHSSNAKRLVEVALDSGAKNAILIDSKDVLKDEDLLNVKSMAVTSAASTPEELVQDLVCYLQEKFDIAMEEFKIQDVTTG